uniref:Phytocyanin domain-containing protein n=1 Tax=Oryza meridionalis TaxID=40149 RepID=A0A0E0D5W8_9ORYZ
MGQAHVLSPPLSLSLFVLLSLTTPPHDRTSKWRGWRRRWRRRFLPPTQVVVIKTSEAERRFPACLGNRKMDAVDKLVVRFHFNGEFLFDGKKTCYVNGCEALSYIDRKKVSLNEIRGQAKEHSGAGDTGHKGVGSGSRPTKSNKELMTIFGSAFFV